MNLLLSDPAFLSVASGVSYDPDAAAYIARVEGASGDNQTLEAAVKDAINAFVVGCKADGIWNAIKASCILAGARTLNGALQPLVGTAPTPYNFVSGDYNRKTGLAGDGSTKYLDSNRNNNDDLQQNNSHNAVYVSVAQSATATVAYMGAGFNSVGDSVLGTDTTSTWLFTRNRTSSAALFAGAQLATGLIGASRSVAASYNVRFSNTTNVVSRPSDGLSSSDVLLYRRSNGAYTDARLAFYSIGESLDLALLDARVTTLINAFSTAIP